MGRERSFAAIGVLQRGGRCLDQVVDDPSLWLKEKCPVQGMLIQERISFLEGGGMAGSEGIEDVESESWSRYCEMERRTEASLAPMESLYLYASQGR